LVSKIPIDRQKGAKGDILLEVLVNLTEDDISDFEIIEEGKPYREWCIPAELINTNTTGLQEVDDSDWIDPRWL